MGLITIDLCNLLILDGNFIAQIGEKPDRTKHKFKITCHERGQRSLRPKQPNDDGRVRKTTSFYSKFSCTQLALAFFEIFTAQCNVQVQPNQQPKRENRTHFISLRTKVFELSLLPFIFRFFLKIFSHPKQPIFGFKQHGNMPNWELKNCCQHDQVVFLVTIGVFSLVILAVSFLFFFFVIFYVFFPLKIMSLIKSTKSKNFFLLGVLFVARFTVLQF